MGVRFNIEGREPLREDGLIAMRGYVSVQVEINRPHDRTLLENAISALDRMAAEAREELVDRLEAEKAKTERANRAVRRAWGLR
jgi:hypothetical protein